MKKGLYIHIPFCDHICAYCDFAKFFYDEKIVDQYIEEVIREIKERNVRSISSIYIGGGTPSSLNLKQLDRLLSFLDENFYVENLPFTFEANPESLTEEKIILLKRYHVNRISLGVQTFNDNLIKKINRYHTKEMIYHVVKLLKKYQLDNINCDLIYGLPGQDENVLLNDIENLISLDIKHISTYALTIGKHTLFYNLRIKEVSDETSRCYYDLIYKKLKEAGFNRYEVSNFSKEGYQSFHNLLYWNNNQYYGIGLGASSYIDKTRFDNTKSLNKYLNHERVIYQEELSDQDIEFYHLMLGLRLAKGINIEKFNSLFNKDILINYKDRINSLLDKRLLVIEEGYLKITENNLFIMDYILKELLL